ncbi:MAG: AAA family ATPase [Candidatus Rhabdochlamydia sp.]
MDPNHLMNSSKQPCAFSSLIGNVNVKERLNTFLFNGKIPQVMLFLGPSGVGKGCFAHQFAQAIVATMQPLHPDIHLVSPDRETNQHSIVKLREVIEETYFPPFQSERKVFIIHDAEKMVPTSMNTLLKTLEEPPSDTIFILTTSSPSQILPTVLSRSAKITFHPIPDEELALFFQEHHNLSQEKAQKLSLLAEGSFVKALGRLEALFAFEALEKGLKATSYLEIYDCLADKKLMLEAPSSGMIEALLEDIIYFVHQYDEHSLARVLRLIAQVKEALDHHVKLKTALEYFFISYRLL